MRTIPVALILLAGLLVAPAAHADERLPAKDLTACINLALEHHPSLKAAAARIDAADERVWQAASTYLPQVRAGYQANRRNTSAGARTGTDVDTNSQTFSFFDTGVSFTQMLFDFGRGFDTIRAARATEQSLQADQRTQRDSVVLSVKQAYFNLLAAQRLLAVADETTVQNRQHLEQAEGRFRVGFAPKFDVTQAQVQLAQAELNQLTARNNVALGRESLRNAVGLTEPLDFDIVDTFDVHAMQMSEDQALNIAYDSRPEIQSVEAQQVALNEQIAALQKDYLPSITGNGNYDWSGTDYPLEKNWNVGAAVNLSIFNGGLTTAQIGEQRANLASLHYVEEELRQDIALEVRQAILNLQRALQSIAVAEKGLGQARENLELAEGRYKTGVGNIIELTDAQTSRTDAEANYVQALYSYKTTVAALERAVGRDLTAAGGD